MPNNTFILPPTRHWVRSLAFLKQSETVSTAVSTDAKLHLLHLKKQQKTQNSKIIRIKSSTFQPLSLFH